MLPFRNKELIGSYFIKKYKSDINLKKNNES